MEDTIKFKSKTIQYSWLSNFWPFVPHNTVHVSNFRLELDGYDWPSVEHYYQYMKYVDVDDEFVEYLASMMDLTTAADIKRATNQTSYVNWYSGREGTTKAAALRRWRKIVADFISGEDGKGGSDNVMLQGVWVKFSKNPDLKQALLATGDRPLAELGLGHWAINGDNALGAILMYVRAELRAGTTDFLQVHDSFNRR